MVTDKRETFDYVIVGAGSAGCILARRLTADGETRVLLLEAGPSDRHWSIRMPAGLRANLLSDSPYNWHFKTEPQRHMDGRRIYEPRGKALGGSSSINGMVFLRGHRLDYEGWRQDGAAGWSYAEVLPYFKRLERFEPGGDLYRGTDGPVAVRRQQDLEELNQAFLEAGRQAGFPATDDVNGARQEGFCRFDMNVDRGVRASSAHAYLRQAGPVRNLTVRTGALGLRVLIERGRATGFAYRRAGKEERVGCAREVILSAGAVGSPQLLLLSGIGPADHLRRIGIPVLCDRPGVGGNLQDHLEVHLQHRCRSPVSLNRYLRPDRKLLAGARWFLFRTGVCARNQANVGAFLRSNDSAAHPNVQFHFFPAFFEGWDLRHDEQGYRLGTGTLRPTSRGTLRLASADPAQAPLIDPNFLATEADRREMREAFALARETLAQRAFARFDAGEVNPGPEVRSEAEIDTFIRRTGASAYHLCGSCRMGAAEDAEAVADPAGRVHGVDGLRVADASLMPSVASSNINAVVMMMAEKLSDAILGRPPLPPIETAMG